MKNYTQAWGFFPLLELFSFFIGFTTQGLEIGLFLPFLPFSRLLSSQLLHLVFSLDKEKKVLIKTEHFLAPNCFILVFSLDNEKGHHRNSFTQLFHGIQNPLMECFYKELRHPVLKPAFAIAFHFPFKRLSAG